MKKVLSGFLAFLLVYMALPGVASAQTASNLSAEITEHSPQKITVELTNTSDKPCQVVQNSAGTTAVTKLMQDGKEVRPQALNVNYTESLDFLMRQQLKTLNPGQKTTITLLTYASEGKYYLRTVTWAPGVGELGSLYTLDKHATLNLELTYDMPVVPENGAPACGAAFASTFSQPKYIPWAMLLSAASLLAVLLIVMILIRKRKHTKAATIIVAIVVTISGMVLPPAPVAKAGVEVPSDMRAAFDACMTIFNAHRDITGPVLDVINDPSNNIHLVPTSEGTESSGIEHNYWIYWNVNDRHTYFGTGGNADPCDSLYHEMYHISEQANGTFSMAPCAGSRLPTKEVNATRAQNLLRERLGLSQRSHYGDIALPTGDCSAPPAAPARCTGPRCGDTNGDPHLRTLDGLRYDFQAAGEFIAARSKNNDYQVQVRQEPWLDSRTVSVNTAAAMKVGKDRLEFRSGKQAVQLLVNGKSQKLMPLELSGGGTIATEGDTTIVTWPDESKAWIRPVGSYGLHLALQPSDALAGNLEGILGDGDGDSKNDIRKRGDNKTIKPTFNELYPDYANSWRVKDTETLFTYADGASTKTYTDKSFPDEQITDVKRLPNYAMAQGFCRSLGISDETILANCILDVVITGRAEFGSAAVASQVLASSSSYGSTKWSLAIPNPEDTATATFDAKAGEKIFIEVTRTNLPSQCGVLFLTAPDGKEVASGCIINKAGHIDGTVLPLDGTYTVTLKPHSATGGADLQLLRIADKTGTIQADGAAVSVNLDKPGVIAAYTFKARAGQLAYLEIPKSTLPSECGVVHFEDSNGREIKNGCIINGKGEIDTVQLPDSGTYTVIVDPNDTRTGRITMKLVTPTADSKQIKMNGSTQTFTLKKPGSKAFFTFNGAAGQRVFVDIPKSDFPSQCGIVFLKIPDGTHAGSGCVINHKGNLSDDGYVLPQSGIYTITIDPDDAATGTSSIRLYTK